jgi:hypothetical protein
VAIAVERFFAVGNPLRARWCLKARYSAIASLAIFCLSAILSGPLFFRLQVDILNCSSSTNGCRVIVLSRLFRHSTFKAVYHVVWSTFGMFLPLVLLLAASCGLVVVLYRSRIAGIASPDRYPCTRVTATVTSVVVTYLVLVCPSAVLETIRLLRGQAVQGHAADTFFTAVLILNLAQALWFGANFLLYCGCAVGRSIRWRRKATGPLTYQVGVRGAMTSSRILTTAV